MGARGSFLSTSCFSSFSFPVSRNESGWAWRKRADAICPYMGVCRIVMDGIRPRICAEGCVRMRWRSVSMSREVTWDHRTCLRRFSRRVTTAEPVVPCPGPPPTQGCRLGECRTDVLVPSMERTLVPAPSLIAPVGMPDVRGVGAGVRSRGSNSHRRSPIAGWDRHPRPAPARHGSDANCARPLRQRLGSPSCTAGDDPARHGAGSQLRL